MFYILTNLLDDLKMVNKESCNLTGLSRLQCTRCFTGVCVLAVAGNRCAVIATAAQVCETISMSQLVLSL